MILPLVCFSCYIKYANLEINCSDKVKNLKGMSLQLSALELSQQVSSILVLSQQNKLKWWKFAFDPFTGVKWSCLAVELKWPMICLLINFMTYETALNRRETHLLCRFIDLYHKWNNFDSTIESGVVLW